MGAILPQQNLRKRHQTRYTVNTSLGSDFLSEKTNPMSIKTKAVVLASSAVVLLFMVVGGMDGVRASSNDGAYCQLQLSERRRVYAIQGSPDRSERRHRGCGLQALWLCFGDRGHSWRAGG